MSSRKTIFGSQRGAFRCSKYTLKIEALFFKAFFIKKSGALLIFNLSGNATNRQFAVYMLFGCLFWGTVVGISILIIMFQFIQVIFSELLFHASSSYSTKLLDACLPSWLRKMFSKKRNGLLRTPTS